MKIYWSNARYSVWSTHVDGADEDRVTTREPTKRVAITTHDVLESRRTDRKVAEDDAKLIRDTFRRKAWVQDTEPDKPATK